MLGLDLKPIAASDYLRYSSLFLDREGAPGYSSTVPGACVLSVPRALLWRRAPEGRILSVFTSRRASYFFPGLTK